MSKTFIEKCTLGEALVEELDGYILEWNNSNSSLMLHEYLGFTQDEYNIWLHNAEFVNQIIYARKHPI